LYKIGCRLRSSHHLKSGQAGPSQTI